MLKKKIAILYIFNIFYLHRWHKIMMVKEHIIKKQKVIKEEDKNNKNTVNFNTS